MFALVFLIVIAIWTFLGYLFWKFFVLPFMHSTALKGISFLVLLTVWLVAPVADEILGAREFEKLCKAMPEVKFYGPVPVGEGAFFDGEGNPKRLDDGKPKIISPEEAIKRGEFIERQSKERKTLFLNTDEWHLLRRWPMPIVELYSRYIDKRTGMLVLESYARYSSGGWLRRGVSLWGYQCPSRGYFPSDEEWIFFSKGINTVAKDGDVK